MFTATAAHFDRLYAFRDMQKEARSALALVRAATPRPIKSILDVGCATGDHVASFGVRDVTGLDLDGALLRMARKKHGDRVRFVRRDFLRARFDRTFDAITSFYGVVAYVRTPANLGRFAANVAHHLAPGGVALIEPWHLAETYSPEVTARHVLGSNVAIARVSAARIRRGVVALDIHYLVAEDTTVRHMREVHRLGLFSRAQHLDAFRAAGLTTRWSEASPTGRGAVIAVKPGADEREDGRRRARSSRGPRAR